MRPLNNTITGWTAIAAGICGLGIPISLAALAVLGGLGDVLGAIIALLIIPVLIAIGRIVMTKHEALGRLVQIVGVLGALIDFVGYVLFISGTFVFVELEAWNATARGLIGLAVLTYALLNHNNPALKHLYVWLSFLLGLVMVPHFIVLIIPMLIAIGNIDMTNQKALGRSVQILGVLGALIELAQYVLVVSGILPDGQAANAHYAGAGAMAIAIIMSVLLTQKDPELRISIVWLGIIFVWASIQTLVGSGLQDEFDRLAQGGSLEDANPFVIALLFTQAPMYLLGWPIWLIWTGRLFLKGQQFTLEVQRRTIG